MITIAEHALVRLIVEGMLILFMAKSSASNIYEMRSKL